VPDSVVIPDSIAAMRAQVEARRLSEEQALGAGADANADAAADSSALTPEFLELCLAENERGDGVLFATLMRDRFVYVKNREKHRPWLVWRGHHWAVDKMGEHIRAVEEVALVYLKAAEDLGDPISRERDLLSDANARVKRANDRAKELKSSKDADLTAMAEVDAEAKQAELEATLHLANYKQLQRKKKAYTERASRLRAKPGAEKCVWWAHHVDNPLAVTGDEIDQQRMMLPCPNGVIDLTTGKLHPGKPGDYLLRAIPIEYPEELGWEKIRHYLETGEHFPFPDWERYVDQLVEPLPNGQPDREVVLCLQKLLGNSFTADVSLHKIVVIWGDGRNGKGVLFRTAQSILGELSWKIKAELLLDQKSVKSTAGPSPELMSLRFKRLVVAAETDKHRYISEALVKDFSGGDVINARDMFGIDEENIDPTWHLWIQTNNIPGGLLKSFSMRKRVVLFHFPFMYVEDVEEECRKEPHNSKWFRPIDHGLGDRLQKGKPHILLWFLRGALLAQRDGVAVPAKLRADMDVQQLLEDQLEQFLRGSCLQNYDPERCYESGEMVNLPCPKDPEKGQGTMYSAKVDIKPGESPADHASGKWSYQGPGIDPTGSMLFKNFYGPFKAWFEENVNDKKDKIPSPKSVGADLRKKGYEVKNTGGQTKIYSDIRILSG
jgi:putative DNA primase/helicase